MEENGKKNHLLTIIVVLLLIWNCFLTVRLTGEGQIKTPDRAENITNMNVTGISSDLTKVIEEITSATVSVSSGSNISSGFIYRSSEDRFYVVTTNHTITDGKAVILLDNYTRLEGNVIGYDLYCDIAVIEVASNFQVNAVKTGDSDLLKAGEFVILMGTPSSQEYANSPELAMVSKPLRTVTNSFVHEGRTHTDYLSCIQLSSGLLAGYSGSGVFNMNGELTGVLTMKVPSANETLAITVNELKHIADEIIENNVVSKRLLDIKGTFIAEMPNYQRSNLGISLEQIDGLYVENVLPTSLAGSFGIKNGDVIITINDRPVNSFSQYLDIIYDASDEYVFNIIRNGSEMTIRESVND